MNSSAWVKMDDTLVNGISYSRLKLCTYRNPDSLTSERQFPNKCPLEKCLAANLLEPRLLWLWDCRLSLAGRTPHSPHPPPATPYVPPKSPRATLNFNYDWRFIREDVPGAEVPGLRRLQMDHRGTPHSFNDVDSFRKIISHGGGDSRHVQGPVLVSQALQAAS